MQQRVRWRLVRACLRARRDVQYGLRRRQLLVMAAQDEQRERINSVQLAAPIVDALLRAGILAPDDIEQALRIVARELEARLPPR